MSKQLPQGSPFYDDKQSLAIYDDRIVLINMNNREIKFDDIRDIFFRKIDFSLYNPRSKKENYFISICLKGGAVVDVKVLLSGYYALKNFSEKGIKSDGTRQLKIISIISLLTLITLLVIIAAAIFS